MCSTCYNTAMYALPGTSKDYSGKSSYPHVNEDAVIGKGSVINNLSRVGEKNETMLPYLPTA